MGFLVGNGAFWLLSGAKAAKCARKGQLSGPY
jgi:hypothetical protein